MILGEIHMYLKGESVSRLTQTKQTSLLKAGRSEQKKHLIDCDIHHLTNLPNVST